MSNQRTAAIAIHRIGLRYACALLLIGASSVAGAQEAETLCPTTCPEVETTQSDCISAFRESAASDDGCELEDATVDGKTCTLTGVCQDADGGWESFNYSANIGVVDDLQNCDGELRAECSE